jgi:hypothetical protein
MKVIQANLNRVNRGNKSGHIRGDQRINGYFKDLPEVGKAFCFFAESYSGIGSFRLIETSYVETVTDTGFITETGSTYELELLGEGDV